MVKIVWKSIHFVQWQAYSGPVHYSACILIQAYLELVAMMAHLHYQVMVGCHDRLVTGLKQGADSLTDALTLPESLRDEIIAEKDQIKKAGLLVGFLKDTIKHYPSRFEDFLGILRDKSDLYPQFGTLVVELEEKKAELFQKDE